MDNYISTFKSLAALSLSATLLVSCTPIWEGGARRHKQSASELIQSHIKQQNRPDRISSESFVEAIPTETKSVDDLIAWGLNRNPGISAKMSAMRAMESRVTQTASLPDPVLKLAPFGDMAQTAAGQVEYSIGLEQRFPAPGKLSGQAGIAHAKTKAASAHYLKEQVDVAYKIRVSWHTYLWAKHSEEIILKQILLLEQLNAVVLARVEAQQAAQSDAVRIQVVLDELKAKSRSWIERKKNARHNLLTQLHLGNSAHIGLYEDVVAFPKIDPKTMLSIAQLTRPDFHSNEAAKEHALSKALIAKSKSRPSFGTFINYNAIDDNGISPMSNGDDSWSVGFSISLPVWASAYSSAETEASFLFEKVEYDRVALLDNAKNEIFGGEADTTNNRMEIMAVIMALKTLNTESKITIYTDSTYVQKGISEWIDKWKINGWRTSNKKDVKNNDLWIELDSLTSKFIINWTWIKGHSGHPENDRADYLANQGVGMETTI